MVAVWLVNLENFSIFIFIVTRCYKAVLGIGQLSSVVTGSVWLLRQSCFENPTFIAAAAGTTVRRCNIPVVS
jgi:hypothetical protein